MSSSSLLRNAWSESPPQLLFYCQPMPNTPDLHLKGSGFADMELDIFLIRLEKDFQNQAGDFYTYVFEAEPNEQGIYDEADTYTLQTWQVFRPDHGPHEALVILYYAAINPYLTIARYMSPELAAEYQAMQVVGLTD
jgi:hypothetical protein